MKFRSYLVLAMALGSGCLGHLWAEDAAGRGTIDLKAGWAIQSSANVQEKGEVISTAKYQPQDWYPATVPATVLTALVADKVYADPNFGTNLRDIPGTRYRVGDNFSNIMMPPESPFRCSWWYRREFPDPGKLPGRRVWLQFDGINFRANVWLNGSRIADATEVAGAYRMYEFDITDAVRADSTNVLAVEVFPPRPTDLALDWVDVNPTPPDKDMGLWRSVRIVTTGPVEIRHPQVISHLDLPSTQVAHLAITADLENATDHPIQGALKARIGSIEISQNIALRPREGRSIAFRPTDFPPLNISSPRVWWPWQMGPQDLYELALEFVADGQVSDAEKVQFGIREVTSQLDAAHHRVFSVNGQKILLRGAFWWSDMMVRSTPERQEREIRYARDLNLNALRMDGKLEDDHFAELADRYGLLLMPGWCCCDHWERWKDWDAEDYTVAPASLRDRLRSFRNHPSVLVWLMDDDNPPPPRVEAIYKGVIQESNWPNAVITSASAQPTTLSENTGVKMNGPYQWVPPIYWYGDTRGGAFGLATEVGPGIAIPPVESLRKFLPPSHLWPPDEVWSLHASGGDAPSGFDLKIFTEALEERYGRANTLEDYTEKAQLMSYEAERAMFEAYSGNKYISTGIIQQSLNNAWPSMNWQLYDYYLRPAGGYFGAKKALEPVHIQYSYDNRSIVAVNSTYRPVPKLQAKATVYDLNLGERFTKQVTFDAAPDSTNRLFTIPDLAGLSTTYFLDLRMANSSGVELSSNFYWLSTKPDVLDLEPDRSTWYYTPTKSFADYTGLKDLAPAEVRVSGRVDKDGNEDVAHITVENPGKQLAFFLRVRLVNAKDEEEILPILLQDSYFSLLPGERKEVTARFEQLPRREPVVEVEGWNVSRQSSRLGD
jgi:exo-1,4-beta-D-glucosaminidase